MNRVFDHYFFFNDTATTEIYALSLHDALPIYGTGLWKVCNTLIPKLLTNTKNMLTWIIGGVESTSFFDISKVFPVGGECRGPSESHLTGGESRKRQEGKRGSVANCWLRRT